MKGKFHPFHKLIGKFGNELFWELMRSIDVVSSGDQTRDLEGSKVGFDEKLGAGLGGGIRVGRFQDVFFRHGVRFKVFSFTVDFIGRNVNEAFDGFANLGGFQEYMGSVNIGMGKGKGIAKGVVDVCLSRKMKDGIDFLLA